MNCINCNNVIPKNRRKKAKFCNSKCSAEYRKNEIIKKWKIDPDSANVKIGLSRTIRNLLLKLSNNKCQLCGFEGYNSKTGNTILEIDHIDGNCHNNSSENLRVICPNCHAMSPTYKGLNKGFGKRNYR